MAFDESHFQAVKREISRHLQDAEISQLAHFKAASIYEKRHKYFIGLPAMVLSMLLTWFLSSSTKAQLPDQGFAQSLFQNVPLVLGLVVSILSGLGAFLSFNERSAKHRVAANGLNALCRDCRNWDTDFPDSSACEKAVHTVQGYRKRLNEINGEAPQIPTWAWRSVPKQRAEGSTTYDGDSPR